MRFWDSSALVPLLVQELTSETMLEELRADEDLVVWWGTRVECASAVFRREREGALDGQARRLALSRLRGLERQWFEVPALPMIRTRAERLLRVHDLRAADSLQLAAALAIADGEADQLPFVSLDVRLTDAADREGLVTISA